MRYCLKLGVGGGAKARRFEAIYRDYFSLQVRNEKLKNMRSIGSYYYYNPVHCRNGGFDAALEFSDGYDIFEVKYYSQAMILNEIHHEAQQVAAIKEPNVRHLGFIAIHGFVVREVPYLYLDENDIL
mgnify:FL=1|jgi:hypothetical protein